MPATVNNQMGGNAETVELDNIPDIAAEQAALAARENAATQQIDKTATEIKQPEQKQVEQKEEVVEELTPAQKQAKAATEAEEQNISIDDFLKQKNTGDKQPEKPAETKPVAAANKQDAKPAVEQRDLTGIAPEYHEAFKRMSNEAFNQLKPLYIEKQQLAQQLAEAKKGGLPENYLEHEQAYVLTPEFAQQSANVEQAETVLNHYSNQLQSLRQGSETYTILQRDAQGRLVESTPIKADRTDVDKLSDVRQAAYQQLLNAQAQLNSVGLTHRQRAAEHKQQLAELDAKAFPIFATKPELQPIVQDTIKQLPAPYRNNPLAPLFAKAVIIMMEQGKVLAAKQAQPQQQQVAATKQAARQPSAAEIASGGAASKQAGQEEVTMDMFLAAKKGML